jgi:hypothetical protein
VSLCVFRAKAHIRETITTATGRPSPENIPKTPNAILKLTSQETNEAFVYLSPIIKDEFERIKSFSYEIESNNSKLKIK